VAKKVQKRPVTRKASSEPPKAAPKPTGKPPVKTTAKAPPKAKATVPVKRVVALPRPVTAGPSLADLAERLRDDIQRSKLTHPDPWTYAAKARAWEVRAQALVEEIALKGDTPATRRTLEALDREVQRDRDFQEARRLF
jgi:hypothetical protein